MGVWVGQAGMGGWVERAGVGGWVGGAGRRAGGWAGGGKVGRRPTWGLEQAQGDWQIGIYGRVREVVGMRV